MKRDPDEYRQESDYMLKFLEHENYLQRCQFNENNLILQLSSKGYAMGLGKPVIQLCKEDTTLHFDIAQKNTIIWKTEEEITHRLKNRILATIEWARCKPIYFSLGIFS